MDADEVLDQLAGEPPAAAAAPETRMGRRAFLGVLASTPLLALAGAPRRSPAPVVAGGGLAAAQGPQQPIAWSTPVDAVAVASFDAEEIRATRPQDLPYTRWVWNRTADFVDYQGLLMVLGSITNGGSIGLGEFELSNRPVLRGIVARLDLRQYAPRAADLERWIKLWDQLVFDPSFSYLITAQLLKFLSEGQLERISAPVWREGWTLQEVDGRRVYEKKRHRIRVSAAEALREVPVVRATPDVLLAAGLERLQDLVGSHAPIVELGYFTGRALSTITHALDEDDTKASVFSEVWGGQYYEWANVPRSKDPKVSDLDALLGVLGISDGKEPFQKVFDRLRSDERLVTVQSKVTGKRRLTTLIYESKARPTTGQSLLAITSDIRDTDVDLDTDALVNFIFSRSLAHEVLWMDTSGFQRGALYNGAGKLVKEVPADVAADTTIPNPHTKRLQAFISCLRCHGPHDGWQPIENNIQRVFRYNPKQVLTLDPDQRDRVLGWYFGQQGKPLGRARDDYAQAVLQATGPWKADTNPLQVNTVKLAAAKVAEIYARDRFDQVDVQQALRLLGRPPAADRRAALAEFWRVFPERRDVDGVVLLEDMRVDTLRSGQSVNANDWAMLYSFLFEWSVSQAAKEPKP